MLHFHLWSVWVYRIFPYYFISGRIVGEKVNEHKICVFVCVQLLSETFLILRRIKRDFTINVLRYSCKVRVIHARCSKNTRISNFMKIRPVEVEFVPCGRTGRHDEPFLSFANAPKKSALMLKSRPSVRDVIPETEPLVGFSWNSIQEFFFIFFREICVAGLNFVQVTDRHTL